MLSLEKCQAFILNMVTIVDLDTYWKFKSADFLILKIDVTCFMKLVNLRWTWKADPITVLSH